MTVACGQRVKTWRKQDLIFESYLGPEPFTARFYFSKSRYEIQPPRSYADRVAEWLGRSGWGVTLFQVGAFPVLIHLSQLIAPQQTAEYFRLFTQSVETYLSAGIESVGLAVMLVERLPESHPGYAYQIEIPPPRNDHGAAVARMLERLKVYKDPRWQPDWEGWRPDWGDGLKQLWRNPDSSRARLTSAFEGFLPMMDLEGPAADLCGNIDGQTSAARLAEVWAERQKMGLDEARAAVREHLSELACRLLLGDQPEEERS